MTFPSQPVIKTNARIDVFGFFHRLIHLDVKFPRQQQSLFNFVRRQMDGHSQKFPVSIFLLICNGLLDLVLCLRAAATSWGRLETLSSWSVTSN